MNEGTLYGISKLAFEILHNLSYPCVEKCVFRGEHLNALKLCGLYAFFKRPHGAHFTKYCTLAFCSKLSIHCCLIHKVTEWSLTNFPCSSVQTYAKCRSEGMERNWLTVSCRFHQISIDMTVLMEMSLRCFYTQFEFHNSVCFDPSCNEVIAFRFHKRHDNLNSSWLIDAIWRHRSGSTMTR